MAKLTGGSFVGVALAVLGSVGVAVAAPPSQPVTVTNFPEVQIVHGSVTIDPAGNTVGINPAQNTVGIDPAKNLVKCQSVGGGTVEVVFVEPTVLAPGESIFRIFDASQFEAIRVAFSCEGLCTHGLVTITALHSVPGTASTPFALQDSRALDTLDTQEFTTVGKILIEIDNISETHTVTAGLLVLGRAN